MTIRDERLLALIPARGGSKGVPGKNSRMLGGLPLIGWSIEAARGSEHVDDIVVTTDSPEIAGLAAQLGARVPFSRPAALAEDATPMIDTVLHALDSLDQSGDTFGYVALLQPTSPLRTASHIDEAVRLLQTSDAEAVVSVCETEHSPLLANTLPPDRRLGSFLSPKARILARQQLPTYYRLNGAIYLIAVATLRREKAFVGEFALAYVMPQDASVDIDTELDFALAELVIGKRQG